MDSVQLKTIKNTSSSHGIKTLKNRILKRLQDENISVNKSVKPRGHKSFFQ
jgi:hypothetical protein